MFLALVRFVLVVCHSIVVILLVTVVLVLSKLRFLWFCFAVLGFSACCLQEYPLPKSFLFEWLPYQGPGLHNWYPRETLATKENPRYELFLLRILKNSNFTFDPCRNLILNSQNTLKNSIVKFASKLERNSFTTKTMFHNICLFFYDLNTEYCFTPSFSIQYRSRIS